MDVTRAVTTAVQLSATVSTVPLKATAHIARGAVNVSEVKPRLGVQFVDPKTSTSYVVPVADLSYILMDVEAYVDVRGLNPIFRDATPVVDLNTLLIGKGVIDPVTTSEGISFEWGRQFNNEVFTGEILDILLEILRTFEDSTPVDDASTIGVGLVKNETILTSELFNLIYDKGVADVVSLIEAAAKGVSRVSQDTQSIVDSNAIGVGKNAQESVTATQAFQSITNFQRIIQESIAQSDTKSVAFEKGVQEFVANSDAAARAFSKIVEDAFSVSESADIEMQFLRLLDDMQNASDESYSLYEKFSSDSITSVDDFSRVLDIGVILADAFTVDDILSIERNLGRLFEDNVLVNPESGLLNESLLNTITVNGSLLAETFRWNQSRGTSESLAPVDAGGWSIQNYAEDYFYEGYVGMGGSI